MTNPSATVQLDTGMPVNDFYKRSGPSQMTDEHPSTYVGKLIRELAADPNVVEFGWEQYTPYFNDGDVCEFSVRDLWLRTTEDDADVDRFNLEVSSYHPTLGTQKYIPGERVPVRYGVGYTHAPGRFENKDGMFPETYNRADKLATVLQNNEVTLLNWFGDHAQITVTAFGIQVDEYDHD